MEAQEFCSFLNLVIKRKRLRTSILELATETDLTNREIQFKQMKKTMVWIRKVMVFKCIFKFSGDSN